MSLSVLVVSVLISSTQGRGLGLFSRLNVVLEPWQNLILSRQVHFCGKPEIATVSRLGDLAVWRNS